MEKLSKKQISTPPSGYYHPSSRPSRFQTKPSTIPSALKKWLIVNIILTVICVIILCIGLILNLIRHQNFTELPTNTAPLLLIPGTLLAYVFAFLIDQNTENPHGVALIGLIISVFLGAILLANSIAALIYFFKNLRKNSSYPLHNLVFAITPVLIITILACSIWSVSTFSTFIILFALVPALAIIILSATHNHHP